MEDLNFLTFKFSLIRNLQGQNFQIKQAINQAETQLEGVGIHEDSDIYEVISALKMDLTNFNWHLEHIEQEMQEALRAATTDERMV